VKACSGSSGPLKGPRELRQKGWFKGSYPDFRMFGRLADDRPREVSRLPAER
jgi:hypothetical protein